MSDQPPTEIVADPSEQARETSLDSPVPLSFPALLRNPGVASRYAHLQESTIKANAPVQRSKKSKVNDNEGKRWVRRKENAQFIGNPHIVSASKKDFVVPVVTVKTTFPEPLPNYLSRNAKISSTTVPDRDNSSANAGRFSLSLKGMRRDLRRSGFRAQVLVRDIETEILEWLETGGTVMGPDIDNKAHSEDLASISGRPIGETSTIDELSRTPLQLVWRVPEDAFARYVIHCCARFHGVVSFSKELSGTRLTYLLRPNVTRPDSFARSTLDTPPATDLDDSSHFASDSDFMSDRDNLSEIVESDVEDSHHLSAIPESQSRSASPAVSVIDEWSVVGGDSDGGGDEAETNEKLVQSFESSVSLNDATPRARLASRNVCVMRSASSPSRSPARRYTQFGRRPLPRVSSKPTLYQFIYS